MFRLRGSQAYSSFRIEKLLATIQAQHPDVQQIDTEYQHLVKLKDEVDADQPPKLTEAELAKLQSLLRYGPKTEEVEHRGQRIFVVPRFGTISPWSTKASDIAKNCGLTKIFRVERGIAFYITAISDLDDSTLGEIAQHLHDPMTESIVMDLAQATKLFNDQPPQPLFEVPLLTEGRAALLVANTHLGLALSDEEIDYLVVQYQSLKKNQHPSLTGYQKYGI